MKKKRFLLLPKSNKIVKPLARMNKKKRKQTQITQFRNEKGDITKESAGVKRIIWDIMNNFMSKNITWTKLTNYLNNTNY